MSSADGFSSAYQRKAPAVTSSTKRAKLLTQWKEISLRGIPYLHGGSGSKGMDCLAAVQHLLGKVKSP